MNNEPNNKLLSIGEASKYLDISIDTLRRWEKREKIKTYRSPGGHRYFRKEDLDKLFGRKYERREETLPRNIKGQNASSIFQTFEIPKEVDISESKYIIEPNYQEYEVTKEVKHEDKIVEIPQLNPVKISSKPTFEQYQMQKEVFTEISVSPNSNQEKKSILDPFTDTNLDGTLSNNNNANNIQNNSTPSDSGFISKDKQISSLSNEGKSISSTKSNNKSFNKIIIIISVFLVFLAFIIIVTVFSSPKVISPIP